MRKAVQALGGRLRKHLPGVTQADFQSFNYLVGPAIAQRSLLQAPPRGLNDPLKIKSEKMK